MLRNKSSTIALVVVLAIVAVAVVAAAPQAKHGRRTGSERRSSPREDAHGALNPQRRGRVARQHATVLQCSDDACSVDCTNTTFDRRTRCSRGLSASCAPRFPHFKQMCAAITKHTKANCASDAADGAAVSELVADRCQPSLIVKDGFEMLSLRRGLFLSECEAGCRKCARNFTLPTPAPEQQQQQQQKSKRALAGPSPTSFAGRTVCAATGVAESPSWSIAVRECMGVASVAKYDNDACKVASRADAPRRTFIETGRCHQRAIVYCEDAAAAAHGADVEDVADTSTQRRRKASTKKSGGTKEEGRQQQRRERLADGAQEGNSDARETSARSFDAAATRRSGGERHHQRRLTREEARERMEKLRAERGKGHGPSSLRGNGVRPRRGDPKQ